MLPRDRPFVEAVRRDRASPAAFRIEKPKQRMTFDDDSEDSEATLGPDATIDGGGAAGASVGSLTSRSTLRVFRKSSFSRRTRTSTLSATAPTSRRSS